MKKLTIRLDDNIHKKLKIQCIEKDISINEFITQLIKQNLLDFNRKVSIEREAINHKVKNIHRDLKYIKATMAYENFELPNYISELLIDTMKGKYTNDQARTIILKKHGLV